jgi:hypothetical protein
MKGRPLKLKRMLVLPVVLLILGVTDLAGSSAPHLTPKDIAFLLVSVAIAAALGAARGVTIELYPQQGELWQRYRRTTVVLWIALIAARIVVIVIVIASAAGASAGGGTSTLLVTLSVSLLAEAAIVGPRALSTGLPFATSHASSGTRPSGPSRSGASPSGISRSDTGSRPVDDGAYETAPPRNEGEQGDDGYRHHEHHEHHHDHHRDRY